jgi:hypothetical protein
MAFTNTWDSTFESVPADSEDINLGANRIRALKVAVRERMQIDHVWEDAQEDGKHNKLTMVPQVSAPATASPDAFLYSQTIGGVTELFYKDSNGNIMQLTQNGQLYPFAPGNFSVGGDLAVANNATVGETLSVGTDFVTGFALFASNVTADTTFQFAANTYITWDVSANQLLFVVNGAVVQTLP